ARGLVTEKRRGPDPVGDPLIRALDGGLARAMEFAARTLGGHGGLEASLIDVEALAGGDDAREIERKPEGIVELEREIAWDHAGTLGGAGRLRRRDDRRGRPRHLPLRALVIEDPDPSVERLAETP